MITFQVQCHIDQKIVLQNYENICLNKGIVGNWPTVSKVAALSFFSSVFGALIYLTTVMRANDRKHWKVITYF